MKLYVTRHGQTVWNAKMKVCGRTDVELTEKGLSQARKLADSLQGKKIDLIICSPLSRARKTAAIVNKVTRCNIIVDDRLIEQDYGKYEGIIWDDLGFLNAKRKFFRDFPGGGESIVHVAHRAYSLIDEVKKKYPDKNVLFVCHGGVCRVINTYFKDPSNEEFFNFLMDNCELLEYNL